MASFDGMNVKLSSAYDAVNLLQLFRAMHNNGKLIRDILTRYQTNADPAFTAAVNALYSAAQLSELGGMANNATALVNDWEANHMGALQG